MFRHIDTYMHAGIHICIHTPSRLQKGGEASCVGTYTHTYTHACMHTYTHTVTAPEGGGASCVDMYATTAVGKGL
jgi:hypothetical protein